MNYDEARKIDAEVAERVMGWTRHAEKPDRTDNRQIDGVLYCPPDYPGILHGGLNVIPHYSTDISDAWLVVEKLYGQYDLAICTAIISDSEQERQWHVVLEEKDTDHDIAIVYAPTAPLALCRAALKALSIDQVK